MSTPTILWALAVLVAGGGLAGLAVAILRNAKKAGQKTAEADYEKRAAEDARATGQVMAEHRDPGDTAGRLRRGTF